MKKESRIKKRIKALIIILSSTLVVICVLFISNHYCLNKASNRLRDFSFSLEDVEADENYLQKQESEEIEGVSFDAAIDKTWTEPDMGENISSYEFRFFINNFSTHLFSNYTVSLSFASPLPLSRSDGWNGDFNYDVEQGTMTFDPFEKTAHDTFYVKSGEVGTFGAIFQSDKGLPKLNAQVEVKGHLIYNIYQEPYVYVCMVLGVIWISAFIFEIFYTYRLNYFYNDKEKSREMINQAMRTIISLIDAKDTYTDGHSVRVAAYAYEIGVKIGLKGEQLTNLYFTALMHDCGKIGIPDGVLDKPDRLTDEEFSIIKKHTLIGYDALKQFDLVPGIRDGARSHHERFDGKGYPDGLKGEQIPLAARIICVADSFDAMSSSRCYRKEKDKDYIKEQLISNKGKQFDPKIVDVMLEMIDEGYEAKVKEKYKDFSVNKEAVSKN